MGYMHSVQEYPSTKGRREGGREGGRKGLREGRRGVERGSEVHVGLRNFYEQDWSPPAGGLCPAWLRS